MMAKSTRWHQLWSVCGENDPRGTANPRRFVARESDPRSMVRAVIDLRSVEFGQPALHELGEVVRAAKRQDVFAPVTIVVSSSFTAVTLRRKLVRDEFRPTSDGRNGLVGVSFQTPFQLAEALAADSLAVTNRRPLTKPIIAAAIRQILRRDSGIFHNSASHPTTERALVRAHRELRDLTPEQLDVLRSTGARAADVVRVHEAITERLAADWFDEFDLLKVATESIEDAPEFGLVVVFLPEQLSMPTSDFLRELGNTTQVLALVGLTGHDDADFDAHRTAQMLGGELDPTGIQIPVGDAIISLSDPDEEVRSAVRTVIMSLGDGVSVDRIAVLYPHRNPYLRLVEEQFEEAGIRHNGDAARRLSDSVLGRFISSMLELADEGLARENVLELLASGPIRQFSDGERHVPAVAWSRRARAAGVIGGLGDWTLRLTTHRDDLVEVSKRRRSQGKDITEVGDFDKAVAETEELLEFVTELDGLTTAGELPDSWPGLCDWLRALVARYLGPRSLLLVDEQQAAETIERILQRLSVLARIESNVTLTVFRRTFEAQTADTVERYGTLGDGVFVGSVERASGADFDLVIVLGLAEGISPTRWRDDGLLPDYERESLEGTMTLTRDRGMLDYRRYLAVLAASTSSILTYPRGDLRRGEGNYPSRWLDDTVASHGALSLEEAMQDDEQSWATLIPSFVSGVRTTKIPVSLNEFDLQYLLDCLDQNQNLAATSLGASSPFELGRQLIESRDNQTFSRYDGNLAGVVTRKGIRTDVVSPTRLQDWADCPHKYFMRHVLAIREPERPEERIRVSALDRGSLIHESADRFFQEFLESRSTDGEPVTYTDADVAAIVRHGQEVATELETRGAVGRPIFWARDREALLNDLRGLLINEQKREIRGRVVASEFGFGVDGASVGAIRRTLPSGRVVTFRGSIDRVEMTENGDLVVVDYKTGSVEPYKGLSSSEPTLAGTKLQLPIYALGARAGFGNDTTLVHSMYWFTSNNPGRWQTKGYDVTDQVLSDFDSTIDIIINGIERGVFPARPQENTWSGAGRCPYCDPDGLGSRELLKRWEALKLGEEFGPVGVLWDPKTGNTPTQGSPDD